ncbi:MAG: OmpA family protein [Chitinophagales bacterium]|nr:OmpA family protein [Chitinophagales bacterium]
MSLPLRLLIAFLVWLLYFLLTYNGCRDELCYACGDADSAVTEEVVSPPEDELAAPNYPLYFQWSNGQAFTGENFDSLRQTILAGLADGRILEITGHYFEDEPKPEGFENMGFARADQVAQLFRGNIPEDQIKLRARLVDERDGVRTGPFEAASFKWEEAEAAVAETVEELEDRIIIRFPFGSTQKEYSPEVDGYLVKLAERVKQTGENIQLTGHTDNVDDDDFNMELGMNRANEIKGLLVKEGVDASLISTSSKGESQPVASNDTAEGRHENRRVEVRLIKNQ